MVFITFEGPEGAGKSTVLALVARKLEASGHQVVCTREPGAGAFGAKVRELLLHGEPLVPWGELCLFLADRAQHVATLIRPALAEGKIVLCDRYADSTVVYQGHARGLPVDQLRILNSLVTESLVPSLTLLFDLPSELGLSRLEKKDRLDQESLEFHQKVRKGFLNEASRESNRWKILDASRPVGEVLEEAHAAVIKLLEFAGH